VARHGAELDTIADIYTELTKGQKEAEERGKDFDLEKNLRQVFGICPMSFITDQTVYLLSTVGIFIGEHGITSFPYPSLGIENSALFFQAANIIMSERAAFQKDLLEKKKAEN
jgi:hypothetical protein